MKEKLQLEIDKSMETPDPKTRKVLVSNIKKEMNLFENGRARGHHLELVFKYLLSILFTSIKPEHAFSTAAYAGNKFRSRLRKDTLHALLVLRLYFRKSK